MAVLLLCAICTSCTRENYNNFNVTLTGTVTDKGTENALSGVLLTLNPGGRKTYTGSDGFFQFNEIETQAYDIQAQKKGYRDERLHINPSVSETVHLNICMIKE